MKGFNVQITPEMIPKNEVFEIVCPHCKGLAAILGRSRPEPGLPRAPRAAAETREQRVRELLVKSPEMSANEIVAIVGGRRTATYKIIAAVKAEIESGGSATICFGDEAWPEGLDGDPYGSGSAP